MKTDPKFMEIIHYDDHGAMTRHRVITYRQRRRAVWGLLVLWLLLSVAVWVDILVWDAATLQAQPVVGYPAALVGGLGPLFVLYAALAALLDGH